MKPNTVQACSTQDKASVYQKVAEQAECCSDNWTTLDIVAAKRLLEACGYIIKQTLDEQRKAWINFRKSGHAPSVLNPNMRRR